MAESDSRAMSARAKSVLQAWQDCYALLDRAQRKEVHGWLCVSLIGRVLIAFGVISIMPFVALISAPESIHTQPVLSRAYSWSGADSYQSFLFMVGLFTVAYYLVTAAFTCFEVWYGTRLSNRLGRDFASALFSKTLHQPYETHLSQSTAEQFDLITEQTEGTIVGVIVTGIEIFSNVVLACIVTVMLMVANFAAAMTSAIVLVLAYSLIHIAVAPSIATHGRRLHTMKVALLGLVREALAGIREIKTYHAETRYAERHAQLASANAELRTSHALLDFIPRQMLEAVVFIGIISFALFSMFYSPDPSRVLPLIALYALAAYRLIPTLREIYAGLETISFARHRVELLQAQHADMPELLPEVSSPLPLDGEPLLTLDNIRYAYPGEQAAVLDGISLQLPVGGVVALTGPSGTGKSTLIDILVGLLRPQDGEILVAGQVLQAHDIPRWQRHIAYISQRITLFDGTLAENIALQTGDTDIDEQRLRTVCEQAHLTTLINGLPDGLMTRFSPDGKQLSGGQLRRLGIARALYRQPRLLILDESLNELDTETQQGILDMLQAQTETTVLIVTHDPRVLASCEQRIELSANE